MWNFDHPTYVQQLSTFQRFYYYVNLWHEFVCLAIGSIAAALSTLMLVLLGMTDIITVIVVALAGPLLGGILAYAAAALTNRYLEGWSFGVAAVIGFLSGPLAFGGLLLVIKFIMMNL